MIYSDMASMSVEERLEYLRDVLNTTEWNTSTPQDLANVLFDVVEALIEIERRINP